MTYLSLQLPGGQTINAPAGIPDAGSNGLGYTSSITQNAVTLLMVFAVIVTLIFLIWGGIQWVSSAGDKAKLAAARARITWAIIGLIVVLFTFLIVGIVGSFFGIKLFG